MAMEDGSKHRYTEPAPTFERAGIIHAALAAALWILAVRVVVACGHSYLHTPTFHGVMGAIAGSILLLFAVGVVATIVGRLHRASMLDRILGSVAAGVATTIVAAVGVTGPDTWYAGLFVPIVAWQLVIEFTAAVFVVACVAAWLREKDAVADAE
jgi:hypothetical protein